MSFLGNTIRLYLAGPMSGADDLNFPKFTEAAQWITERGDGQFIVVPAHRIPPYDHSGSCPDGYRRDPGEIHRQCCYLRQDLLTMLGCDAVAFLPGWEASAGSRVEMTVATATGLGIYFLMASELVDSKGVSWI